MKQLMKDPTPATEFPAALAGFPPELPLELQRQLLEDKDLTLCDLARLAPTCKLFEESYLRQCAVEEKWLAGVATSVFGGDLVSTIVRFLTSPRKMTWSAYNSNPRSFNATLGGPLPTDAELFSKPVTSLLAPAWGLLAPGQKSALTWNFMNPAPGFATYRVQMEEAGTWGPVDIVCDNSSLRCSICVQSPAQVTPFLGLLNLICKGVVAAGAGARAGQADLLPSNDQRALTASLFIGEEKVPWNSVGEIPRDAQRALSALHMWNRRFGNSLPQLELHWGVQPKIAAAPAYLK